MTRPPHPPPQARERQFEPAIPPIYPSCGTALTGRKRKSLCLRYSYFDSCADLV